MLWRGLLSEISQNEPQENASIQSGCDVVLLTMCCCHQQEFHEEVSCPLSLLWPPGFRRQGVLRIRRILTTYTNTANTGRKS